ncbi:MAG: DUF952 domain-containing protein [Pseudomonadota bacterium]
MLIYKIFRPDEWAVLERDGTTNGAPVDVTDGFIHFSTGAQVAETAAKYFAGDAELVLAAVETDRLGRRLRWEPARNGDLFPHLYRPLERADIVWTRPLPLGTSGHMFPPDMS